MSPTLSDGDVVLAWRALRPRVSDVALVRWPARPGQLSVKRLAARGVDGGQGEGWDARGDFPDGSTDSRTLGAAVAVAVVVARLHPRPRWLRRG